MFNDIASEIYFTLLDMILPWACVDWVEDACEEKIDYVALHTEVLTIRERIRERLGAEDMDPDLNALLNLLEMTQMKRSRQMFECGVYYAQTIL